MHATFSADGRYRHLLREPGRHECAWVMLNPSHAGSVAADGKVRTDPTNGRVNSFSRNFGYDGYVIGNVYDWVSQSPKDLWACDEPTSRANDSYLHALATLPLIIVGWGRHAKAERVAQVAAILRSAGAELWCLGVNDDGSPKHPLYLRHDTPLLRWEMPVR